MYNFLSNFSKKKAEITGKECLWHVHKPVEIGYYTIFRIEDIKKYQQFVERASAIFLEAFLRLTCFSPMSAISLGLASENF